MCCHVLYVPGLFPELCGDLVNGSVLGLGDSQEHVDDEEDLDHNEHHEDPGATEHLKTGMMKKKNGKLSVVTCIGSNPSPTRKLADQLTETAMEVAVGLPDWANNSVTKNQGIEPGPVAKPTTKKMTAAMAT